MPLEPLAEAAIEAAGQVAIELGGERIRKSYGWRGCVVGVLAVVTVVASAVWLLR